MNLGLTTGYSGAQLTIDIRAIQEADRLGFDSVWTAEAWGSDAATPLAWVAAQTERIKLGSAIMQIPARTPAMTAMTAMTIDALSKGRMVLGLGVSGPQVVEGWHGVPYSKTLSWMREYIAIIRKILAREEALSFDGVKHQIPYRGEGATGQGKPLKSILHGRADMKIYTGSMAPSGQALAAEIADGVLLAFMDPEQPEILEKRLATGFAKAPGKLRSDFDLAPFVAVVIEDQPGLGRMQCKGQLALYIGGMGSREKNFYNDYVCELGFEEQARQIQDLFLAGNKMGATLAVPDALVDKVYCIGPKEHIAERLEVWKRAGVGTFITGTPTMDVLRLLAECCL